MESKKAKQMSKQNRLIDTGNKLIVAKGSGGRCMGKNWKGLRDTNLQLKQNKSLGCEIQHREYS